MQVKTFEKPKIKFNVNMKCDEPIHKKLLKYEAIKCCFSTPSTNLICGGTGCGKTSYLIVLIKTIFYGCFNDIFLIMPSESIASISDEDNILNEIEDKECIYEDLNEETLQDIYDKVKDNADENYKSLLIIDDHGDKLKGKQEALMLQRMFQKNRHMKLSIFVLCQNFYQMPKIIREITNNVILFNTNKSMNEKFFNEMFQHKKQHFDEMMKLMNSSHDNILCSLKHKRIFYKWDELIFD